MTTIADDPILGYKLRVLLYDFRNITKDPASARQLNATTDEHFISAPYFDQEQAQVIKAAIVDSYLSQQHAPNTPDVGNTNHVETAGSYESLVAVQGQPFDTAVRALFNNHLDKRRASGDARPCGPHDLAPRYEALFVKEIEEEKTSFLSRLRRNGL